MTEGDWANRFSRDVDRHLNEAGQMDSESLPDEYCRALDLARTLAAIDFSSLQASGGPQASEGPNVSVGVKAGWVTNGTLKVPLKGPLEGRTGSTWQ